MAFAVIVGTTYAVEAQGASRKTNYTRAFDGTVVDHRDEWTLVLARLTPTAYATLAADVLSASVAVSGDAFGGPLTLRAEITDAGYVKLGTGVHAYRPTVRLWEPS